MGLPLPPLGKHAGIGRDAGLGGGVLSACPGGEGYFLKAIKCVANALPGLKILPLPMCDLGQVP